MTPEEILCEAKQRARELADCGRLITPRDAWLLSGSARGCQTLWSIVFSVAAEHDACAEDINSFLEREYPQYTTCEAHNYHWDDYPRGD